MEYQQVLLILIITELGGTLKTVIFCCSLFSLCLHVDVCLLVVVCSILDFCPILDFCCRDKFLDFWIAHV